MEDQPSSMFELQIDDAVQTYLKDTTRWTRFLAIVFIVFLVLMLLSLGMMFMFGDLMSQSFDKVPQLSGLGAGTALTIIEITLFLCLIVFGVITYTLLRFSNQARKGIDQQNQVAFEAGISSLKNYLAISGILGMVSLLFVFLGLLKTLIN